jgi:hypothetical protein
VSSGDIEAITSSMASMGRVSGGFEGGGETRLQGQHDLDLSWRVLPGALHDQFDRDCSPTRRRFRTRRLCKTSRTQFLTPRRGKTGTQD